MSWSISVLTQSLTVASLQLWLSLYGVSNDLKGVWIAWCNATMNTLKKMEVIEWH